jgi:hypothetical protein
VVGAVVGAIAAAVVIVVGAWVAPVGVGFSGGRLAVLGFAGVGFSEG